MWHVGMCMWLRVCMCARLLARVLSHATFCEHNPLKAKGCAEVGSVGIPPAVVNALLDALRDEGVEDIDMPATPLAVWTSLQASRRKA